MQNKRLPEGMLDLTIIHFTPELAGEPAWHAHDFHELVYIVHGAYDLKTADQSMQGGPGAWYCYPAGFRHLAQFDWSKTPRAELLLVQWCDGPPISGMLHGQDANQRLFHALSWLYDLIRDPQPSAWEAGQHVWLALRHELPRRTSESLYLLQSVRTYVEDNLAGPIRVEDLASAVGLSSFHFARQFKDATGMSPIRYVMQMRLNAARHLLTFTNQKLDAIARNTGFSSAFHLSARFSEAFGQPPSHYRRQMAK